MRDTFTRDVGERMMKALKDEEKFAPFVHFVSNNTQHKLGLCFRGNDSDSDDGKVIIYRNNHKIWDLCIKNGYPKVIIHLDHARFMENWKKMIKALMDIGFTDIKGKNYSQIDMENGFVVRRESKGRFYYNAIDLEYVIKSKAETERIINESYPILEEMQNEFFNPTYIEEFDVYNARSKTTKKDKRPKNFLKEYFISTHRNLAKDDPNSEKLYAAWRSCEEKHLQQALFLNNHKLKDGLFIYDLEFSQPVIPQFSVASKNQPDMFGIRFDKKGNPEAICFIEVKCTWSAFTGESGIEEHLGGMEQYITKFDTLMEHRKDEAQKILDQYRRLGLYGVQRTYQRSEFDSVKKEIIFVFTTDFPLSKKLHKNVTIGEALKGFDYFGSIYAGDYHKDIYAVKKEY